MHVVVTDSGVGGLSVCAYAERLVRARGTSEPLQLTFVNAALANDHGYNSMPSREVKLRTFDRFLAIVAERYAPDLIYVACNSLSVLLPDVPFARRATIPVVGIVETAVELIGAALASDPRSAALIFATPTTIEAGAYPARLRERGVAAARVVGQACPGLADTISEDRAGARTAAEISRWVAAAAARLPDPSAPVVACLACTHYGYRQDLFAAALAGAGLDATVVDPNERAAEALVAPLAGADGHRDVEVTFVTRYAIPDATIEALEFFLAAVSPPSIAALRGFVHLPDLFQLEA